MPREISFFSKENDEVPRKLLIFLPRIIVCFQIRDFIIAVSEYTNSKVDVIAFSMGVAISRKALLGGQCQDTNKDLGEPITDIVNTYLAVGGLAYGMENCPPVWPACSNVNGMACNSQFLVSLLIFLF